VFANNLLVGRVQKKIGQPEKAVEKQCCIVPRLATKGWNWAGGRSGFALSLAKHHEYFDRLVVREYRGRA
jgi:hypothetical protein